MGPIWVVALISAILDFHTILWGSHRSHRSLSKLAKQPPLLKIISHHGFLIFPTSASCLFAFPSERWRAGGRKRGLRLPNPKKQMTLSALCRIVFVAHMCRQKEKKLPCDVPHLGIGQLCFGLNISKYELQLFSPSPSELCLVVKLMPEMKGNCYFPNWGLSLFELSLNRRKTDWLNILNIWSLKLWKFGLKLEALPPPPHHKRTTQFQALIIWGWQIFWQGLWRTGHLAITLRT